jgi:peptidoglycan/xylan/chitin deacetylase (PgdA/CDA1 family)
MCPHSDNRAASAIFRAFGGAGKPCLAEACQHAVGSDMHVWEKRFLSLWIPITVWVATVAVLSRWLAMPMAILAAIPAGFIVLSLLPLALGGRTPVAQWRIWLLACTLWAVFHRDSGAITGWFAWSWIALFLLNAVACLWLGLRKFSGLLETPAIAFRLAAFIDLHLLAIAAGWFFGWPWAIAGGALIAACYCLAVLRPSCQWLGPVRLTTGDHSLLITIDDGPDPHDTPRLLDLLDKHQVKAVFFMIGEKVRRYPELAREVLRRGHEIGNHTMSHPHAVFWCAGPWRTRREIADCQRAVEEATGFTPRFFRAPCGHRNLFTHPIAREHGLEVMAWTRRGFDAVETDAGKALKRILTKVAPGDIVLVHESTPIAVQVMSGLLQGTGHLRG